MKTGKPALESFVAQSIDRVVPIEIAAMADSLRETLGSGVAAILAYGSCLRGVAASESLIDLYVLTRSTSAMPVAKLSQWACALVPPNIYYAECNHQGVVVRCKYAMLPLDQYSHWMTPETSNPYFWARFAQVSALIYCADDATRAKVTAAIGTALRTAYANARGLTAADTSPLDLWQHLFEKTYATELRSEKASRARDLLEADRSYYEQAAAILQHEPPIGGNWTARRVTGRLWSIARLIKAAFTFTGGADYLAWKIERHSGHKLMLSDWQRRHPVLASITLLPKLLRKGAVR